MAITTFELVVIASLRVRQLVDGCAARIDDGEHKLTVIARREVLAGKVSRMEPATTISQSVSS